MGRRKGSVNLIKREGTGYDKELHIYVTAEQFDRVANAAVRQGMTLSEFCRRAIHDSTLSVESEAFFYVRMPNGDINPPLGEKGYEFVENAKRFANRVDGSVFRAPQSPAPTPDAAGERVVPGELRPDR